MSEKTKTGTVLTREERPFGTARPSHYVETKKMVAFVCPTGTHFGGHEPSRQECIDLGHDPYYTTKKVAREREKVRTEKDERTGEDIEVVEDTETYYVKRRVPNWEQVVYDIANDSGQLPQKRLNEGWLWPEDLGYAPFCDFLGCSIQNPKFHTPVGNYHHRDEAALMMLAKGGREDSIEGVAIYVDDSTSGDRRRAQLDAMGRTLVES
jgi:hypothetical protein